MDDFENYNCINDFKRLKSTNKSNLTLIFNHS